MVTITQISTHRFVQLHCLVDDLESVVRSCIKVANNLASIGNLAGAKLYRDRGLRATHVLRVARRRMRGAPISCPESHAACPYRKHPAEAGFYQLQRNALRIEVMDPSARCGGDLIDGRLGGHWSDYHRCRPLGRNNRSQRPTHPAPSPGA